MKIDLENEEQRVFEDWYRSRNPHGDCEQVHSQWLKSNEYKDFCVGLENQSDKCLGCSLGVMKEMSIYDDWEGMLTCDKCGVRLSK